VGKVFPVNSDDLRRWNIWWKYVVADQVWLWAVGCFMGMFLNVNLATAIAPPGENISGIAAGAYQAQFMADRLWTGFWFLALLNGFCILMSTHLDNTDILVRSITDIIWTSSLKARKWLGENVAAIYYAVLFAFTVWGLIAVRWGHAMDLFKIIGNIAGFVLALASVQILLVNTRLLPKKLQPSRWRRVALLMCCVFYSVIFCAVVYDLMTKWWD